LICCSAQGNKTFGQIANGPIYQTLTDTTTRTTQYSEVLSQNEAQKILNDLQTLYQQYTELKTQE